MSTDPLLHTYKGKCRSRVSFNDLRAIKYKMYHSETEIYNLIIFTKCCYYGENDHRHLLRTEVSIYIS
jgi:hypothetical protein